jgi:hypothetical protein
MATYATSTVPAVRNYLLQQITELVKAENFSDPEVTVVLSGLENPETTDDVILIGGQVKRTPKTTRFVGGGGPGWIEEYYTISVNIMCAAYSDTDFEAVDARAYYLLALCEQAVRDDPSLGQLVTSAAPGVADILHAFATEHTGATVEIMAEVECNATI